VVYVSARITTTVDPFTARVWVWISGRPRCETAVTQAPGAPTGGGIVGVGLGVGLGLGFALGDIDGEALGGPAAVFEPEPLEQPATSPASARADASARARDGLFIASEL
jgi:hypothetical protein